MTAVDSLERYSLPRPPKRFCAKKCRCASFWLCELWVGSLSEPLRQRVAIAAARPLEPAIRWPIEPRLGVEAAVIRGHLRPVVGV